MVKRKNRNKKPKLFLILSDYINKIREQEIEKNECKVTI